MKLQQRMWKFCPGTDLSIDLDLWHILPQTNRPGFYNTQHIILLWWTLIGVPSFMKIKLRISFYFPSQQLWSCRDSLWVHLTTLFPGQAWLIPLFHTGHELHKSLRIDFFLIRGDSWGFIKKISSNRECSTCQSRFSTMALRILGGNRLNLTGFAQEFITISKITLEHASRKLRNQLWIS